MNLYPEEGGHPAWSSKVKPEEREACGMDVMEHPFRNEAKHRKRTWNKEERGKKATGRSDSEPTQFLWCQWEVISYLANKYPSLENRKQFWTIVLKSTRQVPVHSFQPQSKSAVSCQATEVSQTHLLEPVPEKNTFGCLTQPLEPITLIRNLVDTHLPADWASLLASGVHSLKLLKLPAYLASFHWDWKLLKYGHDLVTRSWLPAASHTLLGGCWALDICTLNELTNALQHSLVSILLK